MPSVLDSPDPRDRIGEAVFAENLTLQLLEAIRHVLVLKFGQRLLPGREYDGVLAGGMMLIHPHEGAERPRERVGDRARAALPGDFRSR